MLMIRWLGTVLFSWWKRRWLEDSFNYYIGVVIQRHHRAWLPILKDITKDNKIPTQISNIIKDIMFMAETVRNLKFIYYRTSVSKFVDMIIIKVRQYTSQTFVLSLIKNLIFILKIKRKKSEQVSTFFI